VAAALTGCGGGSGGADVFSGIGAGIGAGSETVTETLLVKATYGVYRINLFSATTLAPTLTGFNALTPVCTLADGQLPDGLSLNRDCTIRGAATKTGSFKFTVNVGAEGVKNSIQSSGEVIVGGPGVTYPSDSFGVVGTGQNLTGILVGTRVNSMPTSMNWAPAAGLSYSVRYEIGSGSLPPGLTLDPSTGAITGTVTTAGKYMATIEGVYTTAYGTFRTGTAAGVNFVLTVLSNEPAFKYPTTVGMQELLLYKGVPVSIAPVLNPAYDFREFSGEPPPGLRIDLGTGVISGTPSGHSPVADPVSGYVEYNSLLKGTPDNGGIVYNLSANALDKGSWVTLHSSIRVRIAHPLTITYPQVTPVAGEALSVLPVITPTSANAIDGATYTFNSNGTQGCPFTPNAPSANGLIIDASTGAISGTPKGEFGPVECELYATVTLNGASWWQLAKVRFDGLNAAPAQTSTTP
jgi:hypothetical protein